MRFFFSGKRRCHPTLKLLLKSPCTGALFSKLSLRKSAVQAGTGAVPIAVLGSITALATHCQESREVVNLWRCRDCPVKCGTRLSRSTEGLQEGCISHQKKEARHEHVLPLGSLQLIHTSFTARTSLHELLQGTRSVSSQMRVVILSLPEPLC